MPRTPLSLTLTGVLGCMVVTACGGPSGPAEPAADRALIRPLTGDGFASLLEASRGDVVLINLWATWCAPCLREIPELVELESDFEERGLRLIGISLDDVDARAEVRAFRDEWFPDFSTYHIDEADWYTLIDHVQSDWNSLLPTSFVLDREGQLSAVLTGGKDYASFVAVIDPLL